MPLPDLSADQLQVAAQSYAENGFLSPLDVLTPEEAAHHRAAMEAAEKEIGPLHYKSKIHTILRSPLALATHPRVLDSVEAILGRDLLLYNVTYIVKEAHTGAHVSWHQDLTYWGFDGDAQVSVWLALSPATAESGCMRMVPGSHHQGMRRHDTTADDSNVLLQGQTVKDVPEDQAVLCSLNPGQASLHHGWTLHASMANNSDDRRIGLNIQYISTAMRQTKHDGDSAMLVRGEDRYHHFLTDQPAERDLDPAAVARQAELERQYREIAGNV